jgi:hypothetical protein
MVSNESSDLYIGYFENPHGEQWLFSFDRRTREATLRGGDVGWGNAYPVRDGRVAGLILGGQEAAWLDTCWNAAKA